MLVRYGLCGTSLSIIEHFNMVAALTLLSLAISLLFLSLSLSVRYALLKTELNQLKPGDGAKRTPVKQPGGQETLRRAPSHDRSPQHPPGAQ